MSLDSLLEKERLEKKLRKEAEELHRDSITNVRRGRMARILYSIGVSLLWCGLYYGIVFRMQSPFLFVIPFILTLPIITWVSKGK